MAYKPPVAWSTLLSDAVNVPGRTMEAYHAFHGYSIGNQCLAYFQCMGRNVPIGPIATYNRWKSLGRQVIKGSKAITLCFPVVSKRKDATDENDTYVFFNYAPAWFVLAQTEGKDVEYPTLPDWDRAMAMGRLGITEEAFSHMDGNAQGYAKPNEKTIAINPVAQLPLKTTIHEMAHCILHSTDAMIADGSILDVSLKECEAESVTLIVSDALGLEGQEYSRDYIQHWWGVGNEIPEMNARRIFTAAGKILDAGRPKQNQTRDA